jgi:hypothetical protein
MSLCPRDGLTINTRRTEMSIRYIAWVTLGIAAAFLVVASTAFAVIDIANLALGVGIGTFVSAVLLAYRYRTDLATLAVAAATAIVSAWTIVYSTVFPLGEVQSLTLADGLALLALSLIGLTSHELAEEHAVRSLTLAGATGETKPEAPPTRMAA